MASTTATSAAHMEQLVSAAWKFAEEYMSQPGFDASHDFNHLRRVVSLALRIYDSSTPEFQSSCDPNIVTLLALLHDVGDKKYAGAATAPGKGAVETFLVSVGAAEDLAAYVQHLVQNVSFSNEQKNTKYVQNLAAQHPELAVVQDADRLDAIGAMGIARVITFSTAKRPQEGWQGIVTHYEEKLGRLAREMKTIEGRKLAETRGERVRMFFEDWWNDEVRSICPLPPRCFWIVIIECWARLSLLTWFYSIPQCQLRSSQINRSSTITPGPVSSGWKWLKVGPHWEHSSNCLKDQQTV